MVMVMANLLSIMNLSLHHHHHNQEILSISFGFRRCSALIKNMLFIISTELRS